MKPLTERLLALHDALDAAGIPHAFGGAIALAYCTSDPRPTTDIDINVFVELDASRRVLEALPRGLRFRPKDLEALERDGQVRLWWDVTPIDLFLNVHAFHREIAGRVRSVPFSGVDIPVLDCVALTVFKALFNRTKDWADIEAIMEGGALDTTAAVRWLKKLLGPDDEVTMRLALLVS